MIRDATNSDKTHILEFCKNTFSWGDYVQDVWNYWIAEGHLFLFENPSPVGICHAFFTKDQIWIEGIRIDPSFRRCKIASSLVNHAESIAKEKHCIFSYMLIDTENSNSMKMALSLEYDISQTWNFYSLLPKKNLNFHIQFASFFNSEKFPHYVKSWRWIPLDDGVSSMLCQKRKIITSKVDGIETFAILSDSEHFEKTLIVTLFFGSKKSCLEIISFLENHAFENNYSRIQILTQAQLSFDDSLEHKLSFHLMKKLLS